MSIHRLIALFLGVSTLLLAGCGGSGSNPAPVDTPEQTIVEETTAEIPAFPTGDLGISPTRRTSDDDYVVDGNGYVAESGEHNRAGTGDSFVLVSNVDAQAWASYGVTGLTGDRPVSLSFDVDAAELTAGDGEFLTLKYWVGVADYTNYSWKWFGQYTGDETIILNSSELNDRFISASGDLHFLVVVPAVRAVGVDHYAVQINTATVTTSPGYLQNKPYYTSAGGVEAGEQNVNVSWTHTAAFGTWDEQNAADEYLVYRRGPGIYPEALIGSAAAPAETYADPADNNPGVEDPVPGVTYYYSVRASNEAGTTPGSIPLPAALPLAIPANVSATDGDYSDKVIVTWTEVEGALSYLVYRDNTETPVGYPGGEPYWEDLEATSGVEYTYWVQATRHIVAGPLSDPDTGYAGSLPVNPDPPADVSATDGDHADKVVVSWTAVTDATGYEIYRDTTATPVETVGAVTSWDDTTVTAGKEYTYWLKAIRDGLTSTLSDPDTGYAESLQVDPDPPADLSASDGAYPDKVVLTWTGATGATAYNIYRNTTTGEAYATVGAVETWEDTAVIPGSVYTYRVQTLQGETTSALSDDDTGYAWVIPEDLELVNYPVNCFQEHDYLSIAFPDPVVRRNPELFFDVETQSLMPVDPDGFIDILKTNGDEFALQVAGGIWPKVAIAETGNPSLINSLDDGMSGVFSYLPNPGRLVVDISVITVPGNPGDPVQDFSYRVFNADGTSVGYGQFEYSPTGSGLTMPVGAAWGINAWDRESGQIEDREYTDFILDGTTAVVDYPTPDVIWVEFDGGWYFDNQTNVEGVYASASSAESDNVLLRFQDTGGGSEMYCGLSPRIAGLTATGTGVIAIYSATKVAFYCDIPGWPGIFDSGGTYTIKLDDPHFAGFEYIFTQNLTVTGPNPNNG